MITLRPYQRESVDALFDYFRRSAGHPLLVLPTGSGKSIVQAAFIQEALQAFPTERFVLVSHVRELLQQNLNKLLTVWPAAPVGLYSAGLNSREYNRQISICGIQSVYQRAHLFGDVGLVLVDEAHLVPKRDGGMYRTFLACLLERNPAMRVIGMSATPYRLDSGALHEGEDRLFTDIAYEANIDRLVAEGYLARLRSRIGVDRVSLDSLHVRAGEYIEGELDALCNTEARVQATVDETIRLCDDRRKWLVFCCSVKHAEHVASVLTAHGVPAGCITGETPLQERDERLASFQDGQLRALTNCNVLTTGFDAPDIDVIVMLRPTLSTGLYVQQCGRGMRVAPGKTDCLVLDFAGNIMQHGPINDVAISTQPSGGPGRYKECPECHAPIPTGCLTCPECGYLYPARKIAEPRHDTKPSDLDIMGSPHDDLVEELNDHLLKTSVRYVTYEPHQSSPAKPLTLQVNYHCARLERFREWVCFDHPPGTYPRRRAEEWWQRRSQTPIPDSVTEAATLAPSLKYPRVIVVDRADQYPRIVACMNLEAPVVERD